MKYAQEALKDGFREVTDIVDPIELAKYRDEGIVIDQDSLWRKTVGDIDIDLEPIGEENTYLLAVYKNRILLIDKVPVKLIQKP